MRGIVRRKQDIYWSKVEEKLDGIDTIISYSKPVLIHMSVSATAGTPSELSAGLIPSYDRYITSFDRTFTPNVSDMFWIDVKPILDDEGNIIIDENGKTEIPPDYKLTKVLDTFKGEVARYGITKIGSENG